MIEKILKLQKQFLSFLQFSKSYIRRHNPLKQISGDFITMLKEFLTVSKKIKMAKYRLNYQKYKLQQMEQLIAQSNQHVFLKGNTLNETR